MKMVPPNFQKQQHIFSSQKIHRSNIKIPQDFQKQQNCTLLSPQACTQPIILASAGGQDQQQHRMTHSHMPGMQPSVWPCNEFTSPQLFHKTTDKKITGLPPPQQNCGMIKQQKPSIVSPDGAYEWLQTSWNNHLLELNNIYNIVFRSSQNPGLAKKFQEIKACADDTTKALRLSWPQFKTLSCDQIQKIIKRVKAIEVVIDKFNNRHQLPSQSLLPQPQPQPQPQQRMNMKVETSEERYIDLQNNRQTFEKQNINQPIQQTDVNPKKQLMSPHRISAVDGSSISQRARSIPGILQPQHSVGQLKEPSTHIEAYSAQASSQLHWVNRTSPLSTDGTSFQNVVASEPDRASKNTPLLVKSTTSPPTGPLPHSQGHVEDAQILFSSAINRNQASSSTGSPPEMQEETDGSALVSRLLDAVKSMSNKALRCAADDIGSVMNDTIGGVACPRRVKRRFDEVYAPSQVTASEAHRTKMPKFEQHKTLLLDEIRETNKRFVETTLDLVPDSKFVGSGSTVVRCSYNPVGPCSRLLPPFSVELLVPADYPQSSPLLLKDSSSVQESHLKEKVKMRFSLSLGQLSQLPSLKEIARKWDDCARSVLTEFAVSTGGGSFSTKYAKWENMDIIKAEL